MDDIELPPLPRMTHYGGTAVVLSAAELRARDAEVARAAIAADRAKGGEAVATVRVYKTGGNAGLAWSAVPVEDAPLLPDGTKLFTRPAHTQDAEQAAIPRYRWVQDDPDDAGGLMVGPVPDGEWVRFEDLLAATLKEPS